MFIMIRTDGILGVGFSFHEKQRFTCKEALTLTHNFMWGNDQKHVDFYPSHFKTPESRTRYVNVLS